MKVKSGEGEVDSRGVPETYPGLFMDTSRIVRPMGFDPRPLGACSGLARGSLEQAARQRVETRRTPVRHPAGGYERRRSLRE